MDKVNNDCNNVNNEICRAMRINLRTELSPVIDRQVLKFFFFDLYS